MPLIVLLYVFNYLDCVNVSFAKLTMNEDLGFSESVYGWGVGICFMAITSFAFPSDPYPHRCPVAVSRTGPERDMHQVNSPND